ncbi:hypothetical protein RHMOL_Rhmol02G0247200 [Rhododendron molle]|nr:hypothetical protein RHMOL_Rhmol02G0247200 [Rhododendron molle]KAI8569039.1 hypothetical protein RHMOL_Rhmol02G0247200 [Rhododendron molle]KAI8569040.1 hypothetical protein RHMOL_Rhmol02G0247200 [Rhododendron molle]
MVTGRGRPLTHALSQSGQYAPLMLFDCKRYEPMEFAFGSGWKVESVTLRSCFCVMVNAIKGLLISCDIPMAQFIIYLDSSLPTSQKFIIHILDSTHLFVQPHVSEMIRSAISEFRDQNSYEKPP